MLLKKLKIFLVGEEGLGFTSRRLLPPRVSHRLAVPARGHSSDLPTGRQAFSSLGHDPNYWVVLGGRGGTRTLMDCSIRF